MADELRLTQQQLQTQQMLRLEHEKKNELRRFWTEQNELIQSMTEIPRHDLPLARIKKIMKSDEDVKMISSEAPVVFAKACELFIMELTKRAWQHTEENRRRTLQKADIATAIAKCDMYDFLIDIVPREDLKMHRSKVTGQVMIQPLHDELHRLQQSVAPDLQQFFYHDIYGQPMREPQMHMPPSQEHHHMHAHAVSHARGEHDGHSQYDAMRMMQVAGHDGSADTDAAEHARNQQARQDDAEAQRRAAHNAAAHMPQSMMVYPPHPQLHYLQQQQHMMQRYQQMQMQNPQLSPHAQLPNDQQDD